MKKILANKMKKRGQTMTFVVLGVVLIALIAIFFFISGRIPKAIEPEEMVSVEAYVQGCLDDVVKIGQGIALQQATAQISFESRLEDYVKDNLPLSCSDFSKFTGYSIRAAEIESVKADLRPNRALTVEVNWPIRVTKGTKIILLREFITKDELNIGCCFNIEVDNNCKAIESKTTNDCSITKSFNIGDKVSFNFQGIGDVCVAC